jgi:hypothetical protein
MKRSVSVALVMLVLTIAPAFSYSQKAPSGVSTITASDLESHLTFLSSPLLQGRLNGSPGLDIAAGYIASQARKIGLKPVAGNSYYYPYTAVKKSIDPEKSYFQINTAGNAADKIHETFYQLYPMGASDFELEGEVVFCGYGLKQDRYKYDDYDTLNMTDKILLIMDRAPVAQDGIKGQFEDQKLMTINGLQVKLTAAIFKRPKALLIVTDPKSGTLSPDEQHPELTSYLISSMTLKGSSSQSVDMPGVPKIIFVHRIVADQLLEGTGHSLEELQNAIDSDLKNHSFEIKGKTLKIKEVSQTREVQLPDVAGIIEGSDPVLKNEVVIFSGHMDHIGGEGDKIYPGADDDASGCSALLELAEAFRSLPKKPLRSVMFLWVSGEEVGLFGSQAYVNNPVFPLDKTVADLNIDMIGRNKGVADTTADTPMTGPNSVFVITDDQSRELVAVANAAAMKNNLILDYSLSGKDHPLSLFSRSDHFNFVKKDIPILFFMTGLHTDYHQTGDVVEKIDFKKMELVTRTIFDIGYQLANKKTRLVVDNPFSKWPDNPYKQLK